MGSDGEHANDGAVFDFGGLFSVAARVPATTAANDRIQPAMKKAAFGRRPPMPAPGRTR